MDIVLKLKVVQVILMDLIQLGNVMLIALTVIIQILKVKLVYQLALIYTFLLKLQVQENVLKIVHLINMLITQLTNVQLHALYKLMVIIQDGFVFHFAHLLHMLEKLLVLIILEIVY